MSNTPLLRYSILVLTALFGVAILVMSVMPVSRTVLGTRPAPGYSASLVERAFVVHILVHILVYGLLACVAWFALDKTNSGAVNKMIALIAIMLLGCASEYLQHRLYDVPLELNDVFTNILSGAAVFGGLAWWARHRKPATEPPLEGEHVAYIMRDLDR